MLTHARSGLEHPSRDDAPPPPLSLSGLSLERDEDGARPVLREIDWTVRRGERWAVLGANGAGKTTLLRVAAGDLIPTTGTVRVAGERLGAPGLRDPRLRLSLLGGAPPRFAAQLTARDVVLLDEAGPAAVRGARRAASAGERADGLLRRFGVGTLTDRRYRECSRGEQQRVLLARSLMREPMLVLLDEPTTGLDLPGREAFLRAFDRLAGATPELATVTVTHHVEELPSCTTHVLLLRTGEIIGAGPVARVVQPALLSACFGVEIELTRHAGRWAARARSAD